MPYLLKRTCSRLGFPLLILFALLLGTASQALGAEKFCSDPPYFGVIDGSKHPAPTQITIDMDCTFQNFPQSRPLTTTINFHTNDPTIYLIIFDNVYYIGNMACANIDHRIWFSNSSYYGSNNACQDLFIPVETIDKKNPAGLTTAAIGVPFIYTLTLPAMSLGGGPSANDLHSIIIWDDLTATGAALTYLSNTAYLVNGGTTTPLGSLINTGDNKHLEFNKTANPVLALIPTGSQIVINLTVVLDNTATNVPGTQFINTAKWQFGRLIDGVYYEPLPGEWGVTTPMTIVESDLVVTKTGPTSVINLGEWAEFTIDVLNSGTWAGDAWNVNIVDRLPSEPSNSFNGGMCDLTPEVTDVTLAGRSLSLNTDYLLSYTGCDLSLTLLDAAGPIGPNERLIIAYRTKVDADSESGAVLTNVAAATQWSNDKDNTIGQTYTCPLTDGTEGTSDCQDAHDLLVALSGYFFEKTVANPDTGELVTSAMAGETLRYTLRLRSIDEPFTGLRFYDDLNASAAFVPGSLSLVSYPAGADISHTGAGILDIRNLSVPVGGVIEVKFNITLASTLIEGFVVLNQSDLINGTDKIADSDDPNINGQADPAVVGDEDPTQVVIYFPQPLPPLKETLQKTATIGEEVTYRITVPGTVSTRPLYDVVVTDSLDDNLEYLGFTRISGPAVTDNSVAPNLSFSVAQIPANQQAVIELRARVRNVLSAQQGVAINNTVSYTYANTSGGTIQPALTSGTVTLHIVEPHITDITKSANPTTPIAGEIVRYSVTLMASGTTYSSDLFDATITDTLGAGLVYAGNPTVTVGTIGSPVVTGDGSTSAPQTLVWSLNSGNADIDIAEGTFVTISYDARVLDSVLANQALTNSVVAQWTSIDGPSAFERNGTDGIGELNDYVTEAATTTVTTRHINATITKERTSDTYGAGDASVRIGDIVEYTLTLSVPEGTLGNLELADTLPQGLKFEGTVSINGNTGPAPYAAVAPFFHTATPEANEVGDPAVGPTTVTWRLGSVTNQSNDGLSDDFIIVYRVRVLNEVFVHTDLSITLNNTVNMSYETATGNVTQTDNDTITALQPMLTVTKSSNPVSGSSIVAGNTVTYTVDIQNTGTAPAYDVVLQDIIPLGIRTGGVTMVSTYLVSSPTPGLANLAPAYDSTTGVATWDFDSGVYTIPAGDTLRVVYSVLADTNLGEGLTLTNQATVNWYYSFDDEVPPTLGDITGEREIYGPTNTAPTTLLTGALPTKTLLSPGTPETTIGQEMVYRIILPGTVSTNALYDVVITDPLDPKLEYVSATVTGGVVGVSNTSTPTQMNIAISEIPAGQQAVIELHTRVRNVLGAQQGVAINNTASYTYANSPGGITQPALTSGTVTVNIVEPNIATITKSANPTTATVGEIVRYSVMLTASSGTYSSDVFDATIIDNLGLGLAYNGNPTVTVGSGVGTDNSIGVPVITGDGINQAQTLLWSLSNANVDIDIAEGTSVTISYDVRVLDNVLAMQELTNSVVAQWTGIDGLNNHERNGTDGIGGLNDYVTAVASATVTTPLPGLSAQKTVENLTTGQSGANASPGDRLRYTITIENTTSIPLSNFSLVDEIDGLNASPMFQPGSIENVSVPVGADYAINGGTLSINNLNIGPNETLTVSFEAILVPMITSGTIVLNQGNLLLGGTVFRQTDDPNVSGDENPTETLITSTPVFRVLKTVQDITSGTSTVMAGDTLRYTITVKNIGTENAVGVTLRDLVPANTTYVANSTRLNGAAVADPSAGVSLLQNGMLIHSPADLTAGAMPADASANTTNVATITFDVRISTNVVDGTIISNQGFVDGSGTGSGPFTEQPSDDPATPVLNDPTMVVVGNMPLVYALKTVQLTAGGDVNGNGLVDPGDMLQYTITMTNSAATAATGVVLTDAIPANTTYVDNSTMLNGAAVADPGVGVSPLVNGMGVVSSGLTPPSPPSSGGTLAAGGTGIVIFKVQVNAGVSSGTIISNQGSVATTQLPTLLTDSDGNPTNGYQPTVITVGNAQQLSIIKSYAVVGGGEPLPDSIVEYTVQATNIGLVPATSVVITDDLSPLATQVTYVVNSAIMNGSTNGITYASMVVTGNYGTTYGNLAPGSSVVLRFRVKLNSTVIPGTSFTNTAQVDWNSPTQTATASVSLTVGAQSGSLNGRVWHDANFNNILDGTEQGLSDWAVDVYRDGQQLGTVYTVSDGTYQVNGLPPNGGTTSQYELRFRAPDAGSNTAMLGWANSPFTNGMQRISNIILPLGSSVQNLNLPLTPNGVVFNSVTRLAIAGATLTMVQASTRIPLANSCFNDLAQQNQVTLEQGFYKFDLNFSDASCPPEGAYFIEVTPPATGFQNSLSQIIVLPQGNTATTPFPVPDCPGNAIYDAKMATSNHCEAMATKAVPPPSVSPDNIRYYLYLKLSDGTMPGQSQIFNNFIPLDPELNGAVAITKVSSMTDVTKGTLVPYTITVNNVYGVPLYGISIIDRFPAGFKYVAGSARIDGNPAEPLINGRELVWDGLELQFNRKYILQLLLVVGSGVSEGEYVNRALVHNTSTGATISEEATATVRVIPDPDFDCTDVIGKVFDDGNLDGQQDPGEQGLPGVRVVTARGLISTSDKHGRFHITCAAVPDEDRGSNFILKLDERSLPTGYRLTTENPRVQRATRGKMLRLNFGATIHRVVRIDIADGVFEPDTTELRMQWTYKIAQLLEELKKGPSVLRLSYLVDVERKGIVQERLEVLKKEITKQWKQSSGGYWLAIETEIFWRRGAPLASQR